MSDSKYAHFVRIFAVRGQFVLGKQNGAIHILGLRNCIYHSSFYLLGVNCAFLFAVDFAIATEHLAKV